MINKIDFNKKKFRKFNGEVIEDIIPYIEAKVKNGEDMRIMVGCDSKQKKRITLYSLVIVLHDNMRKNGAHVVYMRMRTPKEKDLFTRMYNEALYSLELSLWLDDNIKNFYRMPKFEKNKYDDNYPTKRVEVHVDVNPDEGDNKQNKSNIAYKTVMGLLCGSGFYTKAKPISAAASCAADFLVK